MNPTDWTSRCYHEEMYARVHRISRNDGTDEDATGTHMLSILELTISYLQSISQLPRTTEELRVKYEALLFGLEGTDFEEDEIAEIRDDAAVLHKSVGDLEGLMTWIAFNVQREPVVAILRQLRLVASQIYDPLQENIELIASLNRLRFSESGFRRSPRNTK
jgi:hypothetical protein